MDVGPYESGVGDFDCGGVVTICDLAYWPACSGGPSGSYPAGCDGFDSDGDADIDLLDAARIYPLFGCYDEVCSGGCR